MTTYATTSSTYLGSDEAMLVVDETGDVTKGSYTVGTQRQYSGTAGRIENYQVAVYLPYTTSAGHALIDRKLNLPKFRAGNPERRAAEGVPEDVAVATKFVLARQTILRALTADPSAWWVDGDEICGADPGLASRVGGTRRGIRAGRGLQPSRERCCW